MDTLDKVLVIGATVLGALAGLHYGDILGAVIGGFAGIGLLAVSLLLGDVVDQELRRHYRKI